MNQQQLLAVVLDLLQKTQNGANAYANLSTLLKKVFTLISPQGELSVTLTQAQVDGIVNTYLPLYQQALTAIEAAGDALGTDNFN